MRVNDPGFVNCNVGWRFVPGHAYHVLKGSQRALVVASDQQTIALPECIANRSIAVVLLPQSTTGEQY
jgi:hypothetical protein